MPEYSFEVTLRLRGPILTASTPPGAFGIDSPFARNNRGRLYLPGTLVRGKLRQAWTELSSHLSNPPVEQWLGKKTGDSHSERGDHDNASADFAPQRAQARFSDFEHAEEHRPVPVRTRIAINSERGSVQQGMLQILESPFASGEEAAFTGTIHFQTANHEEASQFEKALSLGLRAIPSFGAARAIGFGRLKGAAVARQSSASHSTKLALAGRTLGLCLSTTDYLCIARIQPAGNLFESTESIPGNVLKGALYQTLEKAGGKTRFPLLEKYYSQIRFRQAAPVRQGSDQPPVPLPLSLVQAAGKLHDVAFTADPQLIGSDIPAFRPDWKKAPAEQAALFGWDAKVQRELRVRTHIDAGKRRAFDEHLFAYDMIDPQGLHWLTAIDLPAVPELNALRDELASLLAGGILGVGKTKARLGVAPVNLQPRFASHTSGAEIALTLQTPTLIGDPRTIQGKQDPGTLLRFYHHAFHELSGGTLELKHFFAKQFLSGGLYQRHHFQQDKPYQPWFVTQEGSVFVFQAQPGAEEKLQSWLASGLPLDQGAIAGYQLGDDLWQRWRRCPFVPENGFGEVAVNLHLNANWPQVVRGN